MKIARTSQLQQYNVHPNPPRRRPPAKIEKTVENSPFTTGTETGDLQEYFMDRNVSHGDNENRKPPSAQNGKTTYGIRWYGFNCRNDNFELTKQFQRGNVISYYQCAKRRRS